MNSVEHRTSNGMRVRVLQCWMFDVECFHRVLRAPRALIPGPTLSSPNQSPLWDRRELGVGGLAQMS